MIERPFSIDLPDGATLQGEVRSPEGDPPSSAVVVAHGFKGFKDWGFFPHLCECLTRDGHAVVSFNFSLNGIGEDPTAFTDLEAFGRNTLSREVEEILRLLHEVRDGGITSLPPTRVGLLGHSRGGGGAIVAARDDGMVDALVTWAAVATFDRFSPEVKEEWRRDGRIYVENARTGQKMPLNVGLLEDFEANRERLDIETAARAVTAVPWLIVHGENDQSVSVADARRLARANPRAAVELIPGTGHTFDAVHPFERPTPALAHAIRVTGEHLLRHLCPEPRAPDD